MQRSARSTVATDSASAASSCEFAPGVPLLRDWGPRILCPAIASAHCFRFFAAAKSLINAKATLWSSLDINEIDV